MRRVHAPGKSHYFSKWGRTQRAGAPAVYKQRRLRPPSRPESLSSERSSEGEGSYPHCPHHPIPRQCMVGSSQSYSLKGGRPISQLSDGQSRSQGNTSNSLSKLVLARAVHVLAFTLALRHSQEFLPLAAAQTPCLRQRLFTKPMIPVIRSCKLS